MVHWTAVVLEQWPWVSQLLFFARVHVKYETCFGAWDHFCDVMKRVRALKMTTVAWADFSFVCYKSEGGYCCRLCFIEGDVNGVELVDSVCLLLWWFKIVERTVLAHVNVTWRVSLQTFSRTQISPADLKLIYANMAHRWNVCWFFYGAVNYYAKVFRKWRAWAPPHELYDSPSSVYFYCSSVWLKKTIMTCVSVHYRNRVCGSQNCVLYPLCAAWCEERIHIEWYAGDSGGAG